MEKKVLEKELFDLILKRAELSKAVLYDLFRQHFTVSNIELVNDEEKATFTHLYFK